MNAAHLPSLLSHAPGFGIFFALVLLGLARLRRSQIRHPEIVGAGPIERSAPLLTGQGLRPQPRRQSTVSSTTEPGRRI